MIAQRVTEEQAEGISAYRRGVRLIARTIGMLPLQLEADGVATGVVPPLLQQPVPWKTRQAAVETVVKTLIDHGNYIGILCQWDNVGRAHGVVEVHPREAAVTLLPSGLWYRIGHDLYHSTEVIHIQSGGSAGDLVGKGVLQSSWEALSAARSVSGAQADFYADGMYPGAALEVEDPDISQEEADELRVRYMARVKRNEPLVLPAGIKFVPMVRPTAEQSQLTQASDMSRRQVADLLDLDGDWLGVPASSFTYANIVDRLDNLVRLTCQPWMTAIETAFSGLMRSGSDAAFQTSELFRAQTLDRYRAYLMGQKGGWLDVDEIRRDDRRPPLPDRPEPPAEDMGDDEEAPDE